MFYVLSCHMELIFRKWSLNTHTSFNAGVEVATHTGGERTRSSNIVFGTLQLNLPCLVSSLHEVTENGARDPILRVHLEHVASSGSFRRV